MTTPRIGYVTAMWKRPELTDLVFSHVAFLKEKLAGKLELVPAVAGSEGDVSKAIATKNGFLYAEAPNSPLSNKWNASLALLHEQNVDGVCIFGSDDLPNETYFLRLLEELSHGRDLLGVDGMYFFDQFTGRMFDWKGYRSPRERDVPGAGRFLHRRYLEQLNWRLWPDGLESSLDGAMFQRLRAHCGQDLYFYQLRHREEEVVLVDVKSQTFMSSIESLAAAGPTDAVGNPYAFLQRHFGSELTDKLFPPQTPRLAEADLPVSEIWTNPCFTGRTPGRGPSFFCIAYPHQLGSLGHDALFAFRQMGKTVHLLTPIEFLMRGPRRGDIIYIQPASCHENIEDFILMCSLHSQCHILVDCRNTLNDALLKRLSLLPVTLIGVKNLKNINAKTLPRPFSTPKTPLPFCFRRNVMVIPENNLQTGEIISAYVTANLHSQHSNLFFAADDDLAGNKQLQYAGIFFYSYWRYYSLRQIFHISLFCRSHSEEDIYLSLAAGTPTICVDCLPDGLTAEQGVFPAKNFSEAMRLIKMLTGNAACWQEASDRALTFARTGQAMFAMQFNKLFPQAK